MPGAYFQTAEQAVNVLVPITRRLSWFVGWVSFWLTHLALLVLALALLWWFQITPQQAATALWTSKPFSVAQAVGLSMAGLAAAYLAASKWIWNLTFGRWMTAVLFQDIGPE